MDAKAIYLYSRQAEQCSCARLGHHMAVIHDTLCMTQALVELGCNEVLSGTSDLSKTTEGYAYI